MHRRIDTYIDGRTDGRMDKLPQLDKIEQRAKADVEILKAELFRSSYDLRSVGAAV